MPQKNPHGIDVSEAETRFLRRAFRRFALPYLAAFAVVAWGIGTWLAPDGAASPEEVSELREELAAVRESVSALDERFAAVDASLAKARERVASLEKKAPAAPAKVDTSALERELGEATRRVAALEKRIQEQATAERIDALAERMFLLERQQREIAPAAPAPLPSMDPLRPAPAAIPAP